MSVTVFCNTYNYVASTFPEGDFETEGWRGRREQGWRDSRWMCMRVSESAWPDGECVQEVSHVTCHVTSVPWMGGSGSDLVWHRKRSQPDPNWTGPQRGLGFRPSAWTEPGSGLGSGEYGLQTRPNWTVATVCEVDSCDFVYWHISWLVRENWPNSNLTTLPPFTVRALAPSTHHVI